MLIRNVSTRLLAPLFFTIFAPHLYAQAAQAKPETSIQVSGLKGLPEFPPSNVLLQAALNDLARCVDSAVATSTNTLNASTATDAVLSSCVIPQARLKQMLPPDAYNQGMVNTQQRVSEEFIAQQASRSALVTP
jgi:hypothetical protein